MTRRDLLPGFEECFYELVGELVESKAKCCCVVLGFEMLKFS